MRKTEEEKLKNLARDICKDFKIKVTFKGHQSYAWPKDNTINLSVLEMMSKEAFLSALFHELGHVVNYQNKKYIKYHNITADDFESPYKTRKYKKAVRKIGLKAERYTDKVGSELMKFYYPQLKYSHQYKAKWTVQWFKEYHGL